MYKVVYNPVKYYSSAQQHYRALGAWENLAMGDEIVIPDTAMSNVEAYELAKNLEIAAKIMES